MILEKGSVYLFTLNDNDEDKNAVNDKDSYLTFKGIYEGAELVVSGNHINQTFIVFRLSNDSPKDVFQINKLVNATKVS